MPLPNFIHVGQPKAGSTTLHFTLNQHPNICLPIAKEAHFFDDHYGEGEAFYSDTFFSHWSQETIIGDITPNYWQEVCLRRIANLLPDARITVCLRAPITRCFSHYCHALRIFEEGQSFEDALTAGDYIDRSLSGAKLRTLFDLFPRDRVQVLIFERDIDSESLPLTLMRVQRFLNVEYKELPLRRENTGFLPHVTFVDRARKITDHCGKSHEVRVGDVLVETLVSASSYALTVERAPSDEQLALYRRIVEHTNTQVVPEQIRHLHTRYFEEDVELVRELLSDPLPEWDIPSCKTLRAPARVQSRLKQVQPCSLDHRRPISWFARFGKLVAQGRNHLPRE